MKKILIVGAGSFGVALNSAITESGLALCFELPAGAEPPAELLLVPAGKVVQGRDGRAWNNSNPQGIVDFFRQRGLRVPIDIEHATELKAPKGEAAPAVGWHPEIYLKSDGSIWAKSDWGPKGRDMVLNREYSYYSPAYIYDKTTMEIIGIKSVGLTNTPNLNVPALNSEATTKGAPSMELEQLLAALGLPAGTTFAAALNHLTKLKGDLTVALNAANSPPLDKFVPKADYDLALNRATDAEGKLATQAKETLETAINTAIDAALAAGKITPGTKDYHIAQCRQEGGLARFEAFVAAAPAVAADTSLDKKKPGETETALNAEELQVCTALGISAEEYRKAGE